MGGPMGGVATTGGLAGVTSATGGGTTVVLLGGGSGAGGCGRSHQTPPPRTISSATTATAMVGIFQCRAGPVTGMVRGGGGVAAVVRGGGGDGASRVVSSSLAAGSPWFARASRIASVKALADGKRSSGRFAIARRTTASNEG